VESQQTSCQTLVFSSDLFCKDLAGWRKLLKCRDAQAEMPDLQVLAGYGIAAPCDEGLGTRETGGGKPRPLRRQNRNTPPFAQNAKDGTPGDGPAVRSIQTRRCEEWNCMACEIVALCPDENERTYA
jgi:hypothetical protein